ERPGLLRPGRDPAQVSMRIAIAVALCLAAGPAFGQKSSRTQVGAAVRLLQKPVTGRTPGWLERKPIWQRTASFFKGLPKERQRAWIAKEVARRETKGSLTTLKAG